MTGETNNLNRLDLIKPDSISLSIKLNFIPLQEFSYNKDKVNDNPINRSAFVFLVYLIITLLALMI